MDPIKHFSSFQVENFKGFQKLEINDLGLINLIVGDNNIGKTSVLESLLLNNDLRSTLGTLFYLFNVHHDFYSHKGNDLEVNYFDFFLRKESKSKTIKCFRIYDDNSQVSLSYHLATPEDLSLPEKDFLKAKIQTTQAVAQYCVLEEDGILKGIEPLNPLQFKMDDAYVPYIGVNIGYAQDIVKYYSLYIQSSKLQKEELLIDLNFFIPDIEDIEVSASLLKNAPSLMIRRKNIDTLVPLSMYGEGSIKLFRIIIEIIMCKNQFLLIDEIDSGIHFSRFRIFWKLILKTAQKYNVQIISTTHSLECLKYLKEALEDNDLKNLQSQTKHFVLRRQSDMNIKASAYNFEQFEYALDAGNEIRK